MLKAAIVVTVPGALGGAGLLYGPHDWPSLQVPYQQAFAAEVGLAFDKAAVRSALPDSLEPTSGFTGGIAIYGGDEGWALSPLSTGYVWIDVLSPEGNTPARYMLTGFTSENLKSDPSLSLDVAALGEAYELGDNGVLEAVVRPDQVSALELVVKPSAGRCADASTPGGVLLASASDGNLGVIHMPVALDWCEAEAGWARVTAPLGHVLRPFAPEQILWARFATPEGEGGPELIVE